MRISKIIIAVFLLIVQNHFGQSLTDLVKEAETLYQKTRPNLKFPSSSSFDKVQHFYSTLDSSRNINVMEVELKKLESQQYLKDIGLVFKANAAYNFRNSFDEETNNFNMGLVRAELEWNILKSGYTNNRTHSKRLENEMLILQNNRVQSERELMRRQFRIHYTYVINKETIELFDQFLHFENKYFDFLNKLYFKKYISREKLITVSHQINILKNQMKVLRKENQVIKDSVSLTYKEIKTLPFLQMNVDSTSLQYSSQNIALQKENIRLQHKAVNDLSLSFYVQESFNYSSSGHRFFPSVGIRFKAPIRFNNRKKIIKAKEKILVAQEIDKSVGKYNRFITLIGGYNEKLKDVQNQHKSWEFIEERVRVLSVLKSELNNTETGVLLLDLMEEEFKVLENMLQLKRQLYTSLSHIYEVTEFEQIEELMRPINFNDYKSKKRYALAKSNAYSIEFQIAFIQAKGVYKVEVLKEDLQIHSALQKANIEFQIVEKLQGQLTELAIKNELIQIEMKS